MPPNSLQLQEIVEIQEEPDPLRIAARTKSYFHFGMRVPSLPGVGVSHKTFVSLLATDYFLHLMTVVPRLRRLPFHRALIPSAKKNPPGGYPLPTPYLNRPITSPSR